MSSLTVIQSMDVSFLCHSRWKVNKAGLTFEEKNESHQQTTSPEQQKRHTNREIEREKKHDAELSFNRTCMMNA